VGVPPIFSAFAQCWAGRVGRPEFFRFPGSGFLCPPPLLPPVLPGSPCVMFLLRSEPPHVTKMTGSGPPRA